MMFATDKGRFTVRYLVSKRGLLRQCSFSNWFMHIRSHLAVAITGFGTEPQFTLNICPKRPAISSSPNYSWDVAIGNASARHQPD
jgi:hypothetical protein